MRTKNLLSSLLMAAGITLVFYGLSSALGFTVVGTLASIATIAALLYAGGVIFGSAPERHRERLPAQPASQSLTTENPNIEGKQSLL